MRRWHLSCVNDCKHVPLTPNFMSQALTQSQALDQTQVHKASSSIPKPRPLNPVTILLRSRVLAFLLLLHEKLEPSYPPASHISAPHTYCLRGQNLISFLETSLKFQTLLAPGCTPEMSSFPTLKLLPSHFKAFLAAKSNLLPKYSLPSYSYLPLTFSLLSEYFSALALLISPVGSHCLTAPCIHM